MPTLNFQKEFADDVELYFSTSGIMGKGQTIRAKRKHPIRKGDKIYLFTGMRTKKCRRLAETYCLAVYPITIGTESIAVDGKLLSRHSRNALARKDGFRDFLELRQWFAKTHGLPFTGDLIKW